MAEGSKLASQVWWPVSLLALLLTWVSDYMPFSPLHNQQLFESIDAVLPTEDIWPFNIEGMYDQQPAYLVAPVSESPGCLRTNVK